jgi:hypothetical protein
MIALYIIDLLPKIPDQRKRKKSGQTGKKGLGDADENRQVYGG